MKTETYPEEANLTTGQILRQAREKLELSQQTVADRLCLKLSTVRDIEEDNTQSNIALTFLRGYIRAYAKLVQVPESDILSTLNKQMPAKAGKVSPMQSFSSGKKRKKRDGWLMKITWGVLIVLLGMTGWWWWQNYTAQQKDLASMTTQSDAYNAQAQGDESDLGTSTTDLGQLSDHAKDDNSVVAAQEETSSALANPAANSNASSPGNQSVVNSVPATTNTAPNSAVNTSSADVNNISAVNSDELVMNFKARCWLQITDANGKTLFMGTKDKGSSLKLSGVLPYKLKIGAPAAVDIQFQGKTVDMTRFVKVNRIAQLKLPENN
ncbi:cytoskeleton protein RodZ [Xenorhabdus bovienii]|uniref:cytoskeleton protein RodZ n=1 Tax=Xenorhabdus bovienii TaxID=40576 RepID=UPI0023B24D90|nr:cytoskeleton protein RodZ [Xenorhabdus bovienii]MDE9429460.1 cytoskeleton protein RodZ [Xenorhabdus bovienii]MDE9462329.1 cytoskeleton protein RodZ [Xenorhabdus bovienii]MDE9469151.1 cytoskeleton protein RodZ [Xenorhabdus bovienii]MDE9538038.1 cytoskeleton protein RodZ [Xenorhabdus bovienii]